MLAGRLATNREALCAWVAMNEPAVAEQLAREAFDAVTLDMQHGAVDFAGAMRSILSVALAGKPTIVRVPVGEFALASRLPDAGASGILAPMINRARMRDASSNSSSFRLSDGAPGARGRRWRSAASTPPPISRRPTR